MAGADTTHYTARLLAPDLIERARANALSCPVYRDGALVAPTGTVSIYDAANVAQVDGAAVTVSGSIASYSYTPAASLQLGTGWRVEWTLTLAGVVHVFRNDAALVRHRLYPVVTDADLFRRVSALDPSGSAPITSLSDYQDYLDEAWAEIQLRLIAKGNRPNLVLEPSALRQPHRDLTLAYIFDDLATRLNEAYQAQADRFRGFYETAWGHLNFDYDTDDDGVADQRRASSPRCGSRAGPDGCVDRRHRAPARRDRPRSGERLDRVTFRAADLRA